MGSFAKHYLNDASLGPFIGEQLNKEIAANFWHYKQLIEFPYARPVGGSEPVRFEQHEEEKLLDFLRNHPRNGYVWRGFMDMQALSNKYGMPIRIISISDFNDPNPKVERMEPDSDFIVEERVEEMTLLNTGRVHFDLIRKKNQSTKVPAPASSGYLPANVPAPQSLDCPPAKVPASASQDFTSAKVPAPTSLDCPPSNTGLGQSNKEDLVNLRAELAESKNEIRALKELVSQLLPSDKGNKFETYQRREDSNYSKTLNCTSCGKQYSSKENLSSHINEEHLKKYNCDSCEESFSNEKDLNNHDKNDHTNEHNCEDCDYQTTTKHLLDKHIELKHVKKDLQCKGVGNKKM